MTVGVLVSTNFNDPELPEGSVGKVMIVHDDLGDGVDVRFGDGRLINILSHGLDPAPQPGRQHGTPHGAGGTEAQGGRHSEPRG
jgi:hypothetical protein